MTVPTPERLDAPVDPVVERSVEARADGLDADLGPIADDRAPEPARWRRTLAASAVPALAIAALVVFSMGRFLRYATADALLLTLMSTQKLTFFYWGQDRLANLLPLLAFPVRPEYWNFSLQMSISGCSFFGLIMTFVVFHLRETERPRSPLLLGAATAMTGLVVVFLVGGVTGYTFIFEQQYALSTLLMLLGGWAIMRGSRPLQVLGAGLVGIAILVISATILFAPFLWFAGTGTDNRLRRLLTVSAVSVLAFVLGAGASARFGGGPSKSSLYSNFSWTRLQIGLPIVARAIRDSVHVIPIVLVLVGSVVLLLVRRRTIGSNLELAYLAGIGFGVAWFFAFSANGWVEINQFGYRYFFPVYAAVIFVIAGAVTEVLSTVRSRLARDPVWSARRRRVVRTSVVVGLLAVMGVGFARLAVDGHPTVVDAATTNARAASDFGAEFVVGDYWTVWPAVYVGRANDDDIYGISYRSDPLGSEVAARLATPADGAAPTPRLVCVDGDVDSCITMFSQSTGSTWTLRSVENDAPLIVEVSRAEGSRDG